MDLNALIVGGGIHGVGVLHDLATRHLEGLLLVERHQLASGTSSRTTKLLHGGLRYLEHPFQWGLVREALRERTLLLETLPEVVRPLAFVLPTFKGGRPAWLIQSGLRLYDWFAQSSRLPRSRRLASAEVANLAPYLRRDFHQQKMTGAFLYHDAQMLDDVLVRLVARAAKRLGAAHREHTSAEEIRPIRGGFRVRLRSGESQEEVTCRTVVNAGGAWSNANLLQWGFWPRVTCLLNIGSHLVFEPELVAMAGPDCAATVLPHDDGRIVFFIPWNGHWLLGTTDSCLEETPERFTCPDADRAYLLQIARQYLSMEEPERHVAEMFCGIRTMPVGRMGHQMVSAKAGPMDGDDRFSAPYYLRRWNRQMSALSREAVLDWSLSGLVSIYGGKFTTYRRLSERVGDHIAGQLGNDRASGTGRRTNWFLEDLAAEPELLVSRPTLRRR